MVTLMFIQVLKFLFTKYTSNSTACMLKWMKEVQWLNFI